MGLDSIQLEVTGNVQDRIVLTFGPRPSITVTGLFSASTIEPEPAEVSALLSQVRALQLPAFPRSGAMGLDGHTFTLRFKIGQTASEYSWWVEPPPGWEALAEVASHLIALTGRRIPSTGY